MKESFDFALDPSKRPKFRDEFNYGCGLWDRILIDATKSFKCTRNSLWGKNVYPPFSTELDSKDIELVKEGGRNMAWNSNRTSDPNCIRTNTLKSNGAT